MLLSEVRFLHGYLTIYDKTEFTLKEISLGNQSYNRWAWRKFNPSLYIQRSLKRGYAHQLEMERPRSRDYDPGALEIIRQMAARHADDPIASC
jgi:hypothetical protein